MGIHKYSDKVTRIVDKLMSAKKMYYVGNPVMSDAEYDLLEQELRRIDPQNKFFDVIQTKSAMDKVYHSYPMLSLSKALVVEQLLHWYDNIQNPFVVATPKLDGMSVELKVRDGIFSASTRGDGEFGEDCTLQIEQIHPMIKMTLVKTAKEIGGDIVIRGEAILTDHKFACVNERLVKDGLPILSNSRNGLVGIFNNTSLQEKGYMGFVTIGIYEVLEPEFDSYNESLGWISRKLEDGGDLNCFTIFVVPGHECLSYISVKEAYQKAIEARLGMSYQTDGVVFRVDDNHLFKTMGRTGSSWRGSIAAKYPAQQGSAIIRKVEWSVGSQEITPIAIFDPVVLGGANISRASLHNVRNMTELKAGIGSVLTLIRSGDVIPKLEVGPVPGLKEDGSIVSDVEIMDLVPRICPACHSNLSLTPDLVHLTCTNENCKGKLGRKIEIFCKAIGIEFVGPGIADKLAQILDSPIAILNNLPYTWDSIASSIGPGNASRILKSIEEIKSGAVRYEDFIAGLSYGVGSDLAKKIIDNFGLENCLSGQFDPSTLRGVGNVQSAVIKEAFLKVAIMRKVVEELGLKFTVQNDSNSTSKSSGNIFCVTGNLFKTRKDFITEMESRGWQFRSSVSAGLDFLICNDQSKTSSKLEKAKKLNIKIVNENEVRQMLGI